MLRPGRVLIDGKPMREFPLEPTCAGKSASCRRKHFSSAKPSEKTSLSARKMRPTKKSARRRRRPISPATLKNFPEQYQTLVGERGITLSGGQKQRTAIARAIIRNPRILILDDALSSVDTHTEDKILNHLREVMQGRTTIFISHRVSTVRNADMIAVLHAGRIVELGTHDELLARNGYYSDLYNKQLLEEELAEV